MYLLSAPLEGNVVQTTGQITTALSLRDDWSHAEFLPKYPPQITLAGYPDFVALTLQYARVVNW